MGNEMPGAVTPLGCTPTLPLPVTLLGPRLNTLQPFLPSLASWAPWDACPDGGFRGGPHAPLKISSRRQCTDTRKLQKKAKKKKKEKKKKKLH